MSINASQKLDFPENRLRWIFERGTFIRVGPWGQHLWGNEGIRTGREKKPQSFPLGLLLGNRYNLDLGKPLAEGSSQRRLQMEDSAAISLAGGLSASILKEGSRWHTTVPITRVVV